MNLAILDLGVLWQGQSGTWALTTSIQRRKTENNRRNMSHQWSSAEQFWLSQFHQVEVKAASAVMGVGVLHWVHVQLKLKLR